jgi:hypothetical protein
MQKSTREKTVSAVEVATAMPNAKHLASEEEKVLRMRHGARTSTTAPLPRLGQDNPELASELLLIELDLFRQAKARMARSKVVPISSRTKDKIIRALRRR